MIMMGGDKKKLAQIMIASAYEPSSEANEKAYEERAGEPEGYEAEMLEISSDIMKAFKATDVRMLKDSLYAFFTLCDSMPHEEGEHLGGE